MTNPRKPGYIVGNKKPKSGRGKKRGQAVATVVVRQPRQQQQPKAARAKVRGVEPKLATCTQRFALACADPFNPFARGACVPFTNGSTMKAHAFARFNVSTNSDGNGTIYFCPSVANDLPSYFYSGASSTDLLDPFLTNGTSTTEYTLNTGWSAGVHNGPFSGDVLQPNLSTGNVNGKLVAVGARIQYTGTTLNQGGMYYAYHSPDHAALAGVTDAQIGGFGDCQVVGVNRKPLLVNMFPTKTDEMTFVPASAISTSTGSASIGYTYPFSLVNPAWSPAWGDAGVAVFAKATTNYFTVGVPIAVIKIAGPPSTSFHVEFIAHMEFSGQAAATMVSPNSSDAQGAETVVACAARAQAARTSQPGTSNWKLMLNELATMARENLPVAMRMYGEYQSIMRQEEMRLQG